MKGRGNYACRQKIYDAEREPILDGLEETADFQIIQEWEKTTQFGDRAEIKTLPEHSSAWAKMDARSDLCSGQKCPQFERCFITLMHQRAQESDIIIVNHHLFFADLSLKDDELAGGVLPGYDAVVFDEAHELEDVAGQYFGIAISSYRLEDLRRDIAAMARAKSFGSPQLDRALDLLGQAASAFFALLPQNEGRANFAGRSAFLEENEDCYRDVLVALELTGSYLKVVANPPEEIAPLFRRTQELSQSLQFIMESDDTSYVYWMERRGRGCFLQATPIDVSKVLEQRLFNAVDTVVLTSATLAVAGAFDYAQKRLGLLSGRSLVVPGHFDYQKQALLYVPQHLPDPRDAAFTKSGLRKKSSPF